MIKVEHSELWATVEIYFDTEMELDDSAIGFWAVSDNSFLSKNQPKGNVLWFDWLLVVLIWQASFGKVSAFEKGALGI